MDIFPPHWLLAKMTLALKFGVQRLDRLVAGYLMDQCRKNISSFAKTLTVRVAMYLAKLIASLFRPVLYHPDMTLTDDDTESLLTSQFWVRPVYEEFLHAASRFNLFPAADSRDQRPIILSRLPHIQNPNHRTVRTCTRSMLTLLNGLELNVSPRPEFVQVGSALQTSACCENHARKMRTFFTRRLEPNVSHKVCS